MCPLYFHLLFEQRCGNSLLIENKKNLKTTWHHKLWLFLGPYKTKTGDSLKQAKSQKAQKESVQKTDKRT